MKPTFFASAARLRDWFDAHHTTATELLVGYYKVGSGRPSITWPESVDEALAVGWIDGIRRRIDDQRYTIRFTPRRRGSIWSAVNIRRARALIEQGRMRPAGLDAFEARRENRSGIYAYEQRPATMPPKYEKIVRRNRKAWTFYERQSPSYKKRMSWYIISAKLESTRLGRLAKAIGNWERGLTGLERWTGRKKA